MTTVRVVVNGTPAPQGSKRHVGNGRMIEASKKVGPWREAVRAECQAVLAAGKDWPAGMSGEVRVFLLFILPRPRGHFGTGRNAGRVRPSAPARPATRPDLDKLVRSTLDGLVMGALIADDAQVVDLTASKVWGHAPGVIVEVSADG